MDVKIDPVDYRFYKDDPAYNHKRARAIIDETLVETEKFFGDLNIARDAEAMHRMDMVSSYGVYRFNTGDRDFRTFIGEARYKEMIGEHIMEKIRMMKSVEKLSESKGFLIK